MAMPGEKTPRVHISCGDPLWSLHLSSFIVIAAVNACPYSQNWTSLKCQLLRFSDRLLIHRHRFLNFPFGFRRHVQMPFCEALRRRLANQVLGDAKGHNFRRTQSHAPYGRVGHAVSNELPISQGLVISVPEIIGVMSPTLGYPTDGQSRQIPQTCRHLGTRRNHFSWSWSGLLDCNRRLPIAGFR